MKEIYKSLIYIDDDSRGKLYATITSTGYRDKHSGISNQNKEYDESIADKVYFYYFDGGNLQKKT